MNEIGVQSLGSWLFAHDNKKKCIPNNIHIVSSIENKIIRHITKLYCQFLRRSICDVLIHENVA